MTDLAQLYIDADQARDRASTDERAADARVLGDLMDHLWWHMDELGRDEVLAARAGKTSEEDGA